MNKQNLSLSFRGVIKTYPTPMVMGVLNVTPDSFYSKSRMSCEKELLFSAEKMIEEGVSIIDIGAVSTRPYSEMVAVGEELNRLKPFLPVIRKAFPNVLLSLDTFHSIVAEYAFNEGVDIINDISGGTMDEKMYETMGRFKMPYILSHIKGTPLSMQDSPNYDNVVIEVNDFFSEKIFTAHKFGVHDIIIDPGFGFGKSTLQNFELLSKLNLLHIHNKPVLVGVSRKSMIFKTLKTTPEDALNGTVVLNTVALLKGAHIIRVHDVKEAVEAVKLIQCL
jgi:dihydropteroate synthase